MGEPTKLTPRVMVGYAAAEAGINTVETLLRLYLLKYYTNVVGLSAVLAGLATSLAIAWDAAIDPVMGVISDRTRHRFGGRRGYLLPGSVLLALGMLAVFQVPALDGQAAKFTWLLLTYCFLNTGMTVLSVPYWAMAGEMTDVPHERTKLFGARFAFSNAGAFAAALVVEGLRGTVDADNCTAMPAVAAVAAGFVVATAVLSWLATARVRFLQTPLRKEPLRRAFTAPFGNRAFVPLVLAYVVANFGVGVNAATFLYYYEYVLDLTHEEPQQVVAVFLAVFTLSILVWVKLARRFGKLRPVLLGSLVLGLGTPALYVTVPPRSLAIVMAFGAVGLAAFVGSVVLLDTLLTDVLDHDRLQEREGRAGMFFGVWRFANKVARSLSMLAVGAVLGAAGFVEQSATQPQSVHTALIWLFGPGVGACFLGACWILWRYRFDDQKQAQVRRLLARRSARVSDAAR
jgi:glycoside/pentoside/hexuronide:cation symporter, GPH family